MKKIHFILSSFAFLFFLNCIAQAQPDTISFIHITDLHVIFDQSKYYPDLLEYRKSKTYDQGETRLRQFFETVPQKTGCDMVIATGDLVDFFEGEATDSSMLHIQAKNFSQLLSDYQIPVYLTTGNHDLFSFSWKNNKFRHNQNSAGCARADWIRNVPCFNNGTYYSKNFRAGQTTYKFIFLDDSFYQFHPNDTSEIPYIDKPQFYWLKNQLNESANDYEVIFMHIPITDNDIRQEKLNELYSALAESPSVKLIFAGHEHRNIVKDLPSSGGEKIVQVQTGALVLNSSNWRLARLTENKIMVSAPGTTENELTFPLK